MHSSSAMRSASTSASMLAIWRSAGHLAGRAFARTGLMAALLVGAAGLPVASAQDTATPAPASAPAAALPTPKEIMENYLKATGGREAYAKLTNRVTTSEMEMAAAGIRGSIVITQAAPRQMVSKVDIAGFGNQSSGTDGVDVWEVATAGPRLVTGRERDTQLRLATFNSELDWEKQYTNLKVNQLTDVGGKPAYEMEVTTADGVTSTQWYDKETGLLVKTKGIIVSAMGEIPVETSISDYRDVDGIKLPFKTTQSFNGQEMTLTIKSVTHNTNLPPDTFAMPEIIKKIKDAAQQVPAAPASR